MRRWWRWLAPSTKCWWRIVSDPLSPDQVAALRRLQESIRKVIPIRTEAFVQTGDPWIALQVLQDALLAEQVVPAQVADWLLKGIHLSKPHPGFSDEVPLGVALGLEGGVGTSNATRAFRARIVREQRLAEMRALWRIGASEGEAAVLVASRHEPPLNVDTLRAMWKRARRLPLRADQSSHLWEKTERPAVEDVRQLLATYPDSEETRQEKAAILARLKPGI